ncbi:MAG: hypothetical protein ACI4PH_00150, partial [Faecousia sp.]
PRQGYFVQKAQSFHDFQGFKGSHPGNSPQFFVQSVEFPLFRTINPAGAQKSISPQGAYTGNRALV